MKKKIIILTPIKNEDWILHRFLSVCSYFADSIIIADQYSTDKSREICNTFEKVFLFENENKKFNEAERQILLIDKARELHGIGNILLALDADEILAANAFQSEDWKKMLQAKPGTILYFEKPTFYRDTNTTIRYEGGGWPLGYVDDGAKHTPSLIHSIRVPHPSYAKKLYLNDIKFLHYALVRLDAQSSKQRMYSMLENINSTKSLRVRLRAYPSKLDFSNEGSYHEISNQSWFTDWENLGINMHTIIKSENYWYDYECLKLFNQYGYKVFWFDDIWDFNWELFRKKALQEGCKDVPKTQIKKPNKFLFSVIRCFIRSLDMILLRIKAFLRAE